MLLMSPAPKTLTSIVQLVPCGSEEVLSLIQCQKSEAEANGLSEVKVQLHVYLFPPLGPFRGPQSLWPEGEQVLNASLAAAAVLAKHVSRVVRCLFHPVTELLFKAKAALLAKTTHKKDN